MITEPGRAGTALNTLLVDDLDAVVAGLTDRGITLSPIGTMSNGPRFVTVTDPDGNQLKLAQTQ